ncbi:hypothetical protein [Wolbachia endosymbiont of Pentalonia nigronervosa]|nr:hypothetical protein [Wolbachia endosymbiont of Pentalonia nigronervosa]
MKEKRANKYVGLVRVRDKYPVVNTRRDPLQNEEKSRKTKKSV